MMYELSKFYYINSLKRGVGRADSGVRNEAENSMARSNAKGKVENEERKTSNSRG